MAEEQEAYDPSIYPVDDEFKRFRQQVRECRGYDVDCCPPGSSFGPIILSIMLKDEVYRRSLYAKVDFAVAQINAQAEKHGERYELVALEKVVEATSSRSTLLTFSVREVASSNVVKTVEAMVYRLEYADFELLEWRFKPEATDHQLLNAAPKTSLESFESSKEAFDANMSS